MNDFLPAQHAWAWAFGVCAVAAALEGAFAGTGVKRFLSELKQQQPSLPLWAWAIVGLLYYILYFAVVHGLLSAPPTPVWTPIALGLALVLLCANAAWNWAFFRRKDLLLSFLYFGPYALLAAVLAIVLFRIDHPIAGWYLLYLVFGVYATWWGFKVWRLNPPPRQMASCGTCAAGPCGRFLCHAGGAQREFRCATRTFRQCCACGCFIREMNWTRN